MPTVTETANIIFNFETKGQGAQQAEKSFTKLVNAAKVFAASAAVAKLAQTTIELGKLGVASQAASLRFERFAGSSQQASKFLDAFNKGTQGTVDRVQAMTSASKLLQMGLVETGDEMTQIAAMATRLGDQTMAAGDRINDFALMLANTSIPRLDNFGISSGRVRERMKELQDAGIALNRESAFKLAVMEEGAKSLERLGDVTQTTAHQLDVGRAAWADMKTSMGEMVLAAGEATGALEGIPRRLRGVADMYQAVSKHGTSAQAVFAAWGAILDKNTTMTEAYTRALEEQNREQIDAATGQRFLSGEYERTLLPQRELIQLTDDSALAHQQYQAALAETERAQDAAARSTLEMQRAEEEALRVTQEHEAYLFQASMTFTDFHRRRAETAADYSARIEDAEERHQDALTRLNADGNAELIAQEDARYQEEIAMLQANRTQQEAEQQRSLGRMVLQHFNAWAEMTGLTAQETLKMQADIAEKYGLIERGAAQKLNNMERDWSNTLAVMRGDANSFFDAFMQNFNSLPSEKVIRIRQELSGRPVDIPSGGGGGTGGQSGGTVPPSGGGGGGTAPSTPPSTPSKPVSKPRLGGESEFQRGTVSASGGLALVGERGPELMLVPPGAQILPNDQLPNFGLPGTGVQPGPGFPAPGGGGVQPGPGQFPNLIPGGPIQPGPLFPPTFPPSSGGQWPGPGGGTEGINPGPGPLLPPTGRWPPGQGPGGGGGADKQFSGCNITIYVYTNDAEVVARELEKYMRLRGASSSSMVGH